MLILTISRSSIFQVLRAVFRSLITDFGIIVSVGRVLQFDLH